MKAVLSLTGWNKSASAELLSPQLPYPVIGHLSGHYADIEQQINLIDTPGHVDFTAEVERSLRVLDGAVAVFCAVAGVQPQSETVWRQMDKYRVPRIAFINKMDRVGADFPQAIESIEKRLGAKAQAIFLPIGAEEDFRGLIDLIRMEAIFYDPADSTGLSFKYGPIPEDVLEMAELERETLIETLANFDETIADLYLEGAEIDADSVHSAIRTATIALKLCPVIPGTAFKNKGVQMLLDSIIQYLPSLTYPQLKQKTAKAK